MKTIAVFFGAKSTEHDVSIITALGSVIKPLELTKQYRVEAVYIAKNGAWYWGDAYKDVKLFTSGKITQHIQKDSPAAVTFSGGMVLQKAIGMGRIKKCAVDIAFPATHGTYGEDGSLMGLLRMAGVPFVGCDMEASVVAMNKLLSHQVVSAAGIPSHAYVGIKKSEYDNDSNAVVQKCNVMQYPVFVKPVHLGSSIGITRVAGASELRHALEVAFSYDSTVIVEEAIPNLVEVTLPMMGPPDSPLAASLERPLFDNNQVFDFDKKYMGQCKAGGKGKQGAQGYSELPAKLEKSLYDNAVELARKVYAAVGCSGLARIDMLINSATEQVYFNEINPLPGSLYVHNWRAAGIPPVELVQKLIEYAEQRAVEDAARSTVFETNFLKQF